MKYFYVQQKNDLKQNANIAYTQIGIMSELYVLYF